MDLFDSYPRYREEALFYRRFKHADILPLIDLHASKGIWQVSTAGLSFEGREIKLLRAGRGTVKVLLWSQMHGNEPTATMALFDIFNFLEATGDEFDSLRESVLNDMTLYVVPMLNPDGAERFQRATAQMIDMNRDALALQTPEARILKGLVETLKPDFGFNLHDQDPRYTAGRSPKLATMSFLATSYDYELSVNATRMRSMQLIAYLNQVLQEFIPGQVGRFSDEHEPRAFGDNIQKWGTTLVLVESGGYKGDPERRFARKLNFVALLSAFEAISSGSYQTQTRNGYESIPFNSRCAYDLVIRGCTVRQGEQEYRVDIGINREEVNSSDMDGGFSWHSTIEETGDLSTCYGIEEVDGSGLTFQAGQDATATEVPTAGDVATFLLTQDGKVRYSIENGVVSDPDTD